MKRVIGVLTILIICTFAGSAQAQKDTVVTDSLVLLGGKIILADVLKIGSDVITYKKPGQDALFNIERKQVEKIKFKNGKIEVLNAPIFVMISEDNWQSIRLTEDPEDVQGMYNRGNVKVKGKTNDRSGKDAYENATIRLRKKAATLGGEIILITRSERIGGYGEIPAYEIEGIAYSTKPPEDKDKTDKKGTVKKTTN
jgi:hypothetical protein